MAETVYEYVKQNTISLQDRLDAEGVLLCVERGVSKIELLDAVAQAGDPWTSERFDRAVELACNMPVFDSAPTDREVSGPQISLEIIEGGAEETTPPVSDLVIAKVNTAEAYSVSARTARPFTDYTSTLLRSLQDGGEDLRERGLCAETDPEIFFPEKGGSTKAAKKVCMSCDIREQCLASAVKNNERFGIWGGMSERELRAYRRTLANQ